MAKNTIKLKDYLKVVEEYVAAGTITPGMLIEVTSAGKVQAHDSENGELLPVMFANEDEFQGQEIDDDYKSDDMVQCWIPQRGDMVYAILKAGEDVSQGDSLTSNGDGTLRGEDSGDSGGIVGVATEDLDLSGSGAEDSRIIVRVV